MDWIKFFLEKIPWFSVGNRWVLVITVVIIVFLFFVSLKRYQYDLLKAIGSSQFIIPTGLILLFVGIIYLYLESYEALDLLIGILMMVCGIGLIGIERIRAFPPLAPTDKLIVIITDFSATPRDDKQAKNESQRIPQYIKNGLLKRKESGIKIDIKRLEDVFVQGDDEAQLKRYASDLARKQGAHLVL